MDIFKQRFEFECGYICIKYICIHLKINYIPHQIFKKFNPRHDKLNFLEIKRILNDLELEVFGVQCLPTYFMNKDSFLVIINIYNNHFIVISKELGKNGDRKLSLIDPSVGLNKLDVNLLPEYLYSISNFGQFLSCLFIESRK